MNDLFVDIKVTHVLITFKKIYNVLIFFQSPLAEPESYESFEVYLAGDRVVIDLSLTELPHVKLPKDVVDVVCPEFKV